jgi:hypothetical protein
MSETFVFITKFLEGNDVEEIKCNFDSIIKTIESIQSISNLYDLSSKLFYLEVKKFMLPQVNYRVSRLFENLDSLLRGYQNRIHGVDPENHHILISGAGPCGLRAALAGILSGFKVTIVEKRKNFSRANILTLWPQTLNDLMNFGAKLFNSFLKTNGHPLHLGTREIQLTLLKSCLLLGVQVFYETKLTSLVIPGNDDKQWKAVLSAPDEEMVSKKPNVFDFKVNKTGDYTPSFKCNMVFDPEINKDFFKPSTYEAKDSSLILAFDSLIIAEGENSPTMKSLGFKKNIDKFNQALGLVINLKYNDKDKSQNSMKPLVTGLEGHKILDALKEKSIKCENIEYLKGTTHYIVTTIDKKSLLELGVVLENKSSVDLLTPENIDQAKLINLAQDICSVIGFNSPVDFYEHNPIQIFDFSTRSRCVTPVQFLTPSLYISRDILTDSGPPVFPVGDSLLEPFWPQGLGVNRGFHSSLDAINALRFFHEKGHEECRKEIDFTYFMLHGFSWKQSFLADQILWKTDPLTRYAVYIIKQVILEFKMKKDISWIPSRVVQDF